MVSTDVSTLIPNVRRARDAAAGSPTSDPTLAALWELTDCFILQEPDISQDRTPNGCTSAKMEYGGIWVQHGNQTHKLEHRYPVQLMATVAVTKDGQNVVWQNRREEYDRVQRRTHTYFDVNSTDVDQRHGETLKTTYDPIYALDVNRNASVLAIGSDKTVEHIDLNYYSQPRTRIVLPEPVTNLRFLNDDSLALRTRDKAGQPHYYYVPPQTSFSGFSTPTPGYEVVWHPDATIVAARTLPADDSWLSRVDPTQMLHFWDTQQQREIPVADLAKRPESSWYAARFDCPQLMAGPQGSPISVSPDGSSVIVGGLRLPRHPYISMDGELS
jgi:hypothetical protein